MKKCTLIFAIMLVASCPAHGISVYPFDSAANLCDNIRGSGMTISNAVYTGATDAAGYFSGASSAIGMSSGIVITSGFLSYIGSANVSDSISGVNNTPGDSQLDALIPGYETYDAAVLEFDFTTSTTAAYFTYVFASEEYNEYVGTQYNDVFGFFLNGVNHAVLPGTATPISVNTVNPGMNSSYFVDNVDGTLPIEYDGFTIPLTASFTGLTPGQAYHLKIAIADAGDTILDAGVFIKSGSFSPVVPIPAAVWLFGSGILGLLGFRARARTGGTPAWRKQP